jgi:hypothetical protein
MANEELLPAINLLEADLLETERKANGLRATVNMLREKAGLPPLPEGPMGGDGGGGGGGITEIKPDTFYGKRLQGAVREYLEMRKTKGMGPAKPREIYDAVVAGGYQFETSSDEVALVGLRAMLRKRSQYFHKLPNGTYGLTAWYPHAKAAKAAKPGAMDDDDDTIDATEDDDDSAVA